MPVNSFTNKLIASIEQSQDITDSKLLNALMACIEANRDHVVWMQPNSQIIYANGATCKKLGISADEIIGKYVWEWDPLFPQSKWKTFWQQLQAEKSLTFNSEHKAKNGNVFPVEICAHYFTCNDNEYLFAFARDLTELREQEAQNQLLINAKSRRLDDTLGLLQHIMDSNQDLIFAKDKDFKIIHANKSFLNLYPPEKRDKVIGYTTFEEYSEAEANVFLENDKLAFATGKSENLEKVVFPNGEERIIETRKIRFHDSNHEPYILCVARDVTEKEQLIAQLNAQKAALSNAVAAQSAIYDAILDSIIVINQYGVIEELNKATSTLFGYRKEELIGQNVSCLMDAEDAHEHNAHLAHHLSTGHTSIIGKGREILAKKQSGQLFYAHLSVARYNHGDTVRFVGSLRDISEQVSARRNLEFAALHDALTGLASRRLLEQKLESAISESMRNNYQFSIMFIDLDDFKPVNDTLGHDVGDSFLKTIAERLKASVKLGDLCARVGGDEFVVLTEPQGNAVDCAVLTTKIATRLSADISVCEHTISVSASIGAASFPHHGHTREQLLKHADAAMYDEKRSKKRA